MFGKRGEVVHILLDEDRGGGGGVQQDLRFLGSYNVIFV